jgi:molybdopterin-guanine dinucleotide biosynthesis protein A
MPTFSAALLLGGQSQRMGRDKALLPHPDGGPPRPNMPPQVQIVEDAAKDAGPLGGLAACLRATRTDLLVVLAIDLVRIEAGFLRRLLDASTPDCGAVVRHDSFYEPLAAVYPRALGDLAMMHLAVGHLALQDLLREAARAGMMKAVACSVVEREHLRNFNTPDDVR